MADYREQFPRFPEGAYPDLPPSFYDSSCRHDGQPGMTSDDLRVHIWVDHPDNPHGNDFVARFGLTPIGDDGSFAQDDPEFTTDEWAAVLAYVENVLKPRAAARKIGAITIAQIELAASVDDLDTAAQLLQQAGGIEDGGGASHCLPGPDLWARMTPTARRQALTAWLSYERAVCANDEQASFDRLRGKTNG